MSGHALFIIWLLAFPLTQTVSEYFVAKRRKLERKPPPKDGYYILTDAANLLLYMGIGVILWRLG